MSVCLMTVMIRLNLEDRSTVVNVTDTNRSVLSQLTSILRLISDILTDRVNDYSHISDAGKHLPAGKAEV